MKHIIITLFSKGDKQHFFQQPSWRTTRYSFWQGATEEALPENCKITITFNKWEHFHTEHGEAVENVLFPATSNQSSVGLGWSRKAESLNNCADHQVLERSTLVAAKNSNWQTISIAFLMVHDNGQPHGVGVYQKFQDNKGMEAADHPTHSPGLNSNEHPWKIIEFCISCMFHHRQWRKLTDNLILVWVIPQESTWYLIRSRHCRKCIQACEGHAH